MQLKIFYKARVNNTKRRGRVQHDSMKIILLKEMKDITSRTCTFSMFSIRHKKNLVPQRQL